MYAAGVEMGEIFLGAESVVMAAVEWLRLLVETVGAAVIAVGIVGAVRGLIGALGRQHPDDFTAVRLHFARYLALALEFQLAADVLSTAIAPSWDRIGKLAAVAVIRTGLNFFLMREIKAESTSE